MYLFSLRFTALCMIVLGMAGCVSSPIGELDAVAESGDSILITGHGTLAGKEVRLTDSEDIRQLTQLIDKVQRFQVIRKRERWSFVSETPSVRLLVERNGNSSQVSMTSGMMVIPGDSIAFYGDDKESQLELWNLAMKRLGVDENRQLEVMQDGDSTTP